MQATDWQLKGAELYRAGDLAGANAALLQAHRADPANPDYLLNLAELARMQGDAAAARLLVDRAEAATLAAPTSNKLIFLAAGWLDQGDRGKALDAAAAALAVQDTLAARQLFADALRGAPVAIRHRSLVARALVEAWQRVENLQGAAAAVLRASWPGAELDMAEDPLVAAILTSGALCDERLEAAFAAVRRRLLVGPLPEPLWPLQAALAAQCFINEYIWPVTDEETVAISRLMDAPPTAETILRLAAYVPLFGVPGVADLTPQEWPEAVQAVLRQQVSEPAAERKLAASIPALTAIRDGVSSAVRRQYEEHPYPRWVRAPRQQPEQIERVLRSALPFAKAAPIPNPDAPEILVAGCGTGYHAIHVAQRYRGARVTAVDLSLASLSYARRKAEELGVQNIAFAQADLLEIDGRQFDVVDAAGSLQCLADTAEGVQVLTRALRPGGLFRFGLYSALARRELQAARDLGATYPASVDGIRAFRQVVLGAPADSALKAGVFGSSDFFSASGCRDMLMHVQEHQHTTADLEQLLDDAGLRFLGFVLPPETLNAYRREYPQDQAGLDLAQWGAFEARNPTAFRRMYQFWAQKGG